MSANPSTTDDAPNARELHRLSPRQGDGMLKPLMAGLTLLLLLPVLYGLSIGPVALVTRIRVMRGYQYDSELSYTYIGMVGKDDTASINYPGWQWAATFYAPLMEFVATREDSAMRWCFESYLHLWGCKSRFRTVVSRGELYTGPGSVRSKAGWVKPESLLLPNAQGVFTTGN